MKKLVLLGATGSIGEQALEVIDHLDDWSLLAASCYSDIEGLKAAAERFEPQYLAVADEEKRLELKSQLSPGLDPEILTGESGYEELAALSAADMVINAIVGAAGLKPTLAAIEADNRLGLANKESLVTGGSLVAEMLEESSSELLPVDSEHNALFQLLACEERDSVHRLILTASGGPFFGYSRQELEDVSVEQALDHPSWDMGSKITIDSATLMNKGLEVIEARWLFDFNYDKINVMVHPESIVHSLIELKDSTILAEMGEPDMKMPIQHVLTHPHRRKSSGGFFDLAGKNLNFHTPDLEAFPCLKLAYECGRKGQSYSVVLNAVNEVAVEAFLAGRIGFMGIPRCIESMLSAHEPVILKSVEEILALDHRIRNKAEEVIEN